MVLICIIIAIGTGVVVYVFLQILGDIARAITRSPPRRVHFGPPGGWINSFVNGLFRRNRAPSPTPSYVWSDNPGHGRPPAANSGNNPHSNNPWYTRLFGNYFDARKSLIDWNLARPYVVGKEVVLTVKVSDSSVAVYSEIMRQWNISQRVYLNYG